MSHPYDPSSIEAKWQKRWEDAGVYKTDLKKKAKDPYYSMVMFPYPSGDKLHVGHWYNFAPADSFSRFQRMHGKQTFCPMGFDAFGLPAENYAIKTGVHPDASTRKNVETMITQLKRIGCMYDWEKMVNTSTPEYYRWTQWLFLQMHKHGLAYRKEASVNWCPSCQTVLANEQAQDGTCDRCGTTVVQKPLTQWFWNIKKYAEKLLKNLDDLDWPEKTKTMQRNWIGRSEGAEIEFGMQNAEFGITVFTTRPDTLFGATYLVLAPEHPFVEKITTKEQQKAVAAYLDSVKKKTEMQRTDLTKEKTGVPTGAYAINPATLEQIPVWIADYVLPTYGTGAVMGVPGHDERDFDFASTYKELRGSIRCVIAPDRKSADFSEHVYPGAEGTDQEIYEKILGGEQCWTGPGMLVNSDFLDGLTVADAMKKITAWLEDEDAGREKITYRLRDWLVSRQRYWGAPIPIVYDPEGNPHPVLEKHLPWLLPTDVEFKPTGKSPLYNSKEFRERTEKIFGKGWVPEFDTMDTFVCSSLYYLMYLQAPEIRNSEFGIRNEEKKKIPHSAFRIPNLVDPHIEKTWMPVSLYIGGPEHACMHLIYARFVMMALQDFGFVSHDEPFKKLVHQGLVTHKGAKMSKSKGNVVSPDSFIDRHGSDVFRMYLMFMGPFTDGGDWNDMGIKGIDRFVARLFRLFEEKVVQSAKSKKQKALSPALLSKLHLTIKKVGDDIAIFHFNTAISALMSLLNDLEKEESIDVETAQTIAKLLAPLAPHLAEEFWEMSGGKGFIIDQHWPAFDPKLLKSDTMTIVVQVNGKLRASLEVDAEASKEEILALAKAQENVKKYIESGIKKEIYVPGKLVSFVI
ncbi:leucine--tRNA ligase [Candidatus Peribacteria bacterium RIFCSPHIGHO2_01_FULL_55_13]|nr:MAG: leucine--tRNA ligase [Candidatus Peribacteria bacterium RIFCSPHIGHO2_01_FULL_55_13]